MRVAPAIPLSLAFVLAALALPAAADPQRNIVDGRNLQPTQEQVMARVVAFCERVAADRKAGLQVRPYEVELCDGMNGPAWETAPKAGDAAKALKDKQPQ